MGCLFKKKAADQTTVIGTPVPPVVAEKSLNEKLVELAVAEASLGLKGAEAQKKYAAFFNKWFGAEYGKNGARIPWCAAFVTYCVRQCGVELGMAPNPRVKGFEQYCWALVETWQQWAIEKGCYYDNDGKFVPKPGDIVLFDWDQIDISQIDNDWEDHIGIHVAMSGQNFICAEGNTDNDRAVPNKVRVSRNIQGWIRLPAGLKSA